jgi:hypothetical protein
MKAYVSGFGSPGINGIYNYNVDIDGYPSYKKDDYNYLIYYKEYMPYSMSPQYYLIKVFYFNDECQKIKVPKFHVLGNDPTETQWKTDSNSVSGETKIGTVVIIESSSSSSSYNSGGEDVSTSSSSSTEYMTSSTSSSTEYMTSSSSSINDNMYIGGAFTGRSEKWDGYTVEPMGTFTSKAYAYTSFNGELYAAGGLDDGVPTGYCVKWDGNEWVATAPVSYQINGLCVFNNELYACGGTGYIDQTGTGYCVKWNGSSWVSVGTETSLNGHAYTLCVFNNELYMCGDFAGYCAKLSGNTWVTVGDIPLAKPTYTMCVFDGELYVGTYEIGCLVLQDGSWVLKGDLFGEYREGSYILGLIEFNNALHVCWAQNYEESGEPYQYLVDFYNDEYETWTQIGHFDNESLVLCVFNGNLYTAGGNTTGEGDPSGYCYMLKPGPEWPRIWNTIKTFDNVVTALGIF